MMDNYHVIRDAVGTHREFLISLGRTISYVLGLLGLTPVFVLFLILFYALSYQFYFFFHLVHIQETAFRFVLAGIAATFILRFVIRAKRVIWWVWGTQTPDFEPNLEPQKEPNEELIQVAQRKGACYFCLGLSLAYLVALFGFYRVGFLETTYNPGFPEVPLLSDVLNYLSQFPLITNLGGLTVLLPASNPISYISIGAVLGPLIIGIYNISYVLENNRFIRDDIRSDPLKSENIYLVLIALGVPTAAFLVWMFLYL